MSWTIDHPATGLLRHDYKWLPGALAALFAVATAIGNFFLAIYFKEDLGFSGMQIGIIFAVQAVTGVLACFPAGFGNDRLKSSTLITASLLLIAAAYLLLGSVKVFAWVVLAYFFYTLASSVFRMSLDLQVLKNEDAAGTPRRIGIYNMCRFFGLAIGTLACGSLIHAMTFDRCFQLCAVACLLMLFLVRSLPPTRVSAVHLFEYKADLGSRRVWLFGLWLFLFATHWGAENTSYGIFLREDLHLNWQEISLYFAVEYVALGLAIVVMGGKLRLHGSLRGTILAGLAASGCGHIGMVTHVVWLSAAFRALHGAGDGLITLVQYMGVARLFSLDRLGGNNGFINTLLMLGFIVGSLIYGPLGENIGYRHALWMSGALTLLLALPFCFFREKPVNTAACDPLVAGAALPVPEEP